MLSRNPSEANLQTPTEGSSAPALPEENARQSCLS